MDMMGGGRREDGGVKNRTTSLRSLSSVFFCAGGWGSASGALALSWTCAATSAWPWQVLFFASQYASFYLYNVIKRMGKSIRFFGATESQDEDEPDLLFTPWSAIHFFSGAIANSWLDIGFWPWEAIHVAYELKDWYLHNSTDNETQEYNSLPNSVADQAIATLGHMIATTKRSKIVLVGGLLTLVFVASQEELG